MSSIDEPTPRDINCHGITIPDGIPGAGLRRISSVDNSCYRDLSVIPLRRTRASPANPTRATGGFDEARDFCATHLPARHSFAATVLLIVAYGVWVQGGIDVSLRNSMISRQDVGIQFDSLLNGNVSHVEVINSELTRNTTALNFVDATASAQGQIAINGSQIFGSTDAIKIANSAVGGNTTVSLMNSHIAYTGGSGIQMANSAADPNTGAHGIRALANQQHHGDRGRPQRHQWFESVFRRVIRQLPMPGH
jgi:hypothetical protein